MIIDSHVHAGEAEHFSERFATEMMAAVGQPREGMQTCLRTLLGEMDRAGVDKAFLLAFDAERTLGVKVPNEYVAQLCRAHPDRFIGFCSVDAGTPRAGDAVYHCGTRLGMRGVKIAPAYVHLSPSNRCWYEVYEAAQALHMPVLLHTGFTPIKEAGRQFFPPMLITTAAADFPHVSFILAHLGTPWVMPCLQLLAKHANLYADLSIFGWFQPIEIVARALTAAREHGVLDRLLWGTDYPMCLPSEFLARMERLRLDRSLFPDRRTLSDAECTALLGATAYRLIDTSCPRFAEEVSDERVSLARAI